MTDEHTTLVPLTGLFTMTTKKKTELFDKDGNSVYVITDTDQDGNRIERLVNASGVAVTGTAVMLAELFGGVVDVSINGVNVLSRFFSENGPFRQGGRIRVDSVKEALSGKSKEDKKAALLKAIEDLEKKEG